MERCWHGKFGGKARCPEEGRYGNPEFRDGAERPGLNATLTFMRASRWCAAHKHPDDRLLEPEGGGAAREAGTRPLRGEPRS